MFRAGFSAASKARNTLLVSDVGIVNVVRILKRLEAKLVPVIPMIQRIDQNLNSTMIQTLLGEGIKVLVTDPVPLENEGSQFKETSSESSFSLVEDENEGSEFKETSG